MYIWDDLPSANLGFLTTASSIKLCEGNNCDIDGTIKWHK